MKRAVIFGAGSVGRGLLGELLCEAGWSVTFIDVNVRLVAALAAQGAYPHVTVSDATTRRVLVGPVAALDGADREAVVEAVVMADLVATSVGAAALPAVCDTLAPAVARRIELGRPPLNVLLAENMHGCAAEMRALLAGRLPDVPEPALAAQVGLLATSIGRMIPSCEPTVDEPTLVRAEPYRLLPFDAAAVLGEPLEVPGLVADPSVPFAFYGDRKLYVHNLGHCFLACLGRLAGVEYVWQAIGHVELRYLVRGAMLEAAIGLGSRYRRSLPPLVDHVDDLLRRFGNRALADTNARVARDLDRKLRPDDRLLGAFRLAAEEGAGTRHLSLAVAAAVALRGLPEGAGMEFVWPQLEAGLAGVLDDERRGLLARQVQSLAVACDPAEQIALLDDAIEPSRIS